jgi:enoyl-CoA hydratase/carnithine racemase
MTETDRPPATVSEDGAIVTVTFDRPDKRNVIGDGVVAALSDAAQRLGTRPDLRVLLIRAEGEWFSAGIDLHSDWARSLFEPHELGGVGFRQAYRQLHELYDELEAIEKPVVLAVQGPCWGAGVELACSVDFRLASRAATFSLPEVRFGSLAGSGGASRLTRIVGPHWAKWLAMAGQPITADDALRIGLVHEVSEVAGFDDRARAFCEELAGLPAEAVGLSKLVIDAAVDADRTTARHLDRIAVTTVYGSAGVADHRRRFEP